MTTQPFGVSPPGICEICPDRPWYAALPNHMSRAHPIEWKAQRAERIKNRNTEKYASYTAHRTAMLKEAAQRAGVRVRENDPVVVESPGPEGSGGSPANPLGGYESYVMKFAAAAGEGQPSWQAGVDARLADVIAALANVQRQLSDMGAGVLAAQVNAEADQHPAGLCSDTSCAPCVREGETIMARGRQAVVAEIEAALTQVGGEQLRNDVAAAVQKGARMRYVLAAKVVP